MIKSEKIFEHSILGLIFNPDHNAQQLKHLCHNIYEVVYIYFGYIPYL